MRARSQSHGMMGEPLLEPLLARYRYRYSLATIQKLVASGIRVRGFDIGCGYHGSFVRQAGRLPGVEFYGGDVAVDTANPNLLLFDFNASPVLPFVPNIITMHAVLEHLDEPEAAVRYVYDLLEPGGHFLFTVPSNAAKPVLEFLSFKLGLISRQEIEDHKRYYNRASCIALLRGAGFEHIRHHYFQLGMNNRVIVQRHR